jgi:hypothetical protein
VVARLLTVYPYMTVVVYGSEIHKVRHSVIGTA